MLYFLAGLPRSGSTVLAAILNQHPDLHVTATSGLPTLIGSLKSRMQNDAAFANQGTDKRDREFIDIARGLINGKYATIDKPIIIDKSRTWPAPDVIDEMEKITGKPMKIIATVRNIPDCVASFIRAAKPNNLEDFIINSELIKHVQSSYEVLFSGYSKYPEKFLFVEYDKFLANPHTELDKIRSFLDIPFFDYDLNNIDGEPVREKDKEVWNVPGLHDIKKKLGRVSDQKAKDVLGHYYDRFNQPQFWNGPTDVAETLKQHDNHPLNVSVRLAINGKFDEAKRLLEKLHAENDKDHRVAYNLGFYKLREGDLQGGMQLKDRGRIENIFGNRPLTTPMPLWDGRSPGTILLNLEGGLGDQIHGVRYAKDISNRGCRVIVAASGELLDIIQDVDGVSAAVAHGVEHCVYHDYWVPSMSSVRYLKYNFSDLKGTPYISRPKIIKRKKFTIGLRWQGNPKFENQQHRLFPPDEVFNAVKGTKADYISLQRDVGSEHTPDWLEKVPLDTWKDTRMAIAQCDLVITSCTSVAHLAAAMGTPTWIITPVLPYYLWALPGPTTVHYNCVKLFRQTQFGKWTDVMKEVKKSLRSHNMIK